MRIAAYPWYSAQPCSYYPDSDLSILALSVGPAATITTEFPATMAPGYAILANSVQVRWQSTDNFPTGMTSGAVSSSQNSLPSTASSSLSASQSSILSTASSSPSAKSIARTSNGLSSGAKAGIGVSISLVSLGVIIGAFLCLRRRRTTSNPSAGTEIATGEADAHGLYLKPELEATTLAGATQRNELDGFKTVGRSELETSPISELAAT